MHVRKEPSGQIHEETYHPIKVHSRYGTLLQRPVKLHIPRFREWWMKNWGKSGDTLIHGEVNDLAINESDFIFGHLRLLCLSCSKKQMIALLRRCLFQVRLLFCMSLRLGGDMLKFEMKHLAARCINQISFSHLYWI